MYQSKLFIIFILLNILCGSYVLSYQTRKLLQLFKQHTSDHDNRYVWFTRNIHDEDEHVNQKEIFFKKINKIFSRKISPMKFKQF